MSKSGKKDGQNSSEFTLEVSNKMGVHARPAAMIVRIASRFEGEIWITKEDERVNAKSIRGIMMLAAAKGTILKFEEILQALIDFRSSLHDPNAIQEISSVAQGKTAGKEFQFGQHGRSRAQGVYPESKQQGQKMRIPRNFSANRDLDSVFLPYFKHSPQRANDGWVMRLVKVGNLVVNPIYRKKILNQIIRADAEEINL